MTPAQITAIFKTARSQPPAELPVAVKAIHGQIIKPDRVVVLSLDSRPDRWEALNESAKKSKFLSRWPIERYRARPPAEMIIPDGWGWGDTHYATRVDHLQMIEQSYAAGHEYLMILEDDAIIQDCFDEAYAMACRALPAGWLGLWLTSDGHKRAPVPVAPGLVRSTDQAMLHAYLLNRRGMRRVWHHITDNPRQIIDGATEDLHSIDPHFYATEQNAVRQMGCRDKGVRTDFFDKFGAASAARKTPAVQARPATLPKASGAAPCGTCGKTGKGTGGAGVGLGQL